MRELSSQKWLIALWALLLVCGVLLAEPVSPFQAQQIAQNWRGYWQADSNLALDATYLVKDVKLHRLTDLRQMPDTGQLYLVRFQDGGWVLVPADDNLRPVLAYSSDSDTDIHNLPPAFLLYLKAYAQDVDYVRNLRSPVMENRIQWEKLQNNDFNDYHQSRAIVPLLQTKWNQDWPYNELCPLDTSGPGGRVYAGCVATAMGQVMKYWNSPINGVGSHSYYAYGYGYQSANFGNATYLWDEMPNSIGFSNIPIATLLYHAAVSVDMGFSPNGSGANGNRATQALKNYFKYPNASYAQRWDYSSSSWENLIRGQLDNGVPMYYSGSDEESGHAFNCDGYQGTNYFHFNFGWGGSGDGYFYLNAVNPGSYTFNMGQAAITNCIPQGYNINSPRIMLSGSSATAGDPYSLVINSYPVLSSWNISNFGLDIFYEDNAFDFENVEINGCISEGGNLTVNSSIPGQLQITWNRNQALFGGGTLMKLNFRSKEAGTFAFIPISMHYNGNNLNNLEEYMVQVSPPVANMADSRLHLSNALHIGYGEMATVNLSTSYLLPSWNIRHYEFDLGYNPSLVEYHGLLTEGTLSQNVQNIEVTEDTPGVLHISLESQSAITGYEGLLLGMQFLAIGNTSANTPCHLSLRNFYFNNTPVNASLNAIIVLSPVMANDEEVQSPLLRLSNYPNPFNPETNISLNNPKAGMVELSVYNLKGQKVQQLHKGQLAAGNHHFVFQALDSEGKSLGNGIYLLRLQGDGYSLTRKMSLMK